MKNQYIFHVFLFVLITNSSCRKDFLDAKPSTSISLPTSLEEFSSLLDNHNVINQGPGLGILAADEYEYSSSAIYQSISTATERNSYIWAKDLYEGENSAHWNSCYSSIFYANNVLAGIEKLDPTENSKELRRIKGASFFIRAFAYYDLVRSFSPIFDDVTASSDLGLPLRIKPSIDELLPRSSVRSTYELILRDLFLSASLFDNSIPVARSRPSKAAAHALISRIYLTMRDYSKAELHADTTLSIYNKLIDFNKLNKTTSSPFVYNHDEQIYNKFAVSVNAYNTTGSSTNGNRYTQIPKAILDLYSSNDLRFQIFFVKQTDGTYDFKRDYNGPGVTPFIGLATDEIYLIKAECAARRNDVIESMATLNKLLINRYVTAKFEPEGAASSQEALNKVLVERRKELIRRGLRWDDLKRLNKEGRSITLIRFINSQVYTLQPQDPKYVFPIPENEISLSGLQQNLR